MLRPAGTHEIRWLAVLLVLISLALNRVLGLNPPPEGEQEPIAENILQVRAPGVSVALFSMSHLGSSVVFPADGTLA